MKAWVVVLLGFGCAACASAGGAQSGAPEVGAQEAQAARVTVFQQHIIYKDGARSRASPMVYFDQEGGALEMKPVAEGCLEQGLRVETRAGVVELTHQGQVERRELGVQVPLVIKLVEVDQGCAGVELVLYRGPTPQAFGYQYIPEGV